MCKAHPVEEPEEPSPLTVAVEATALLGVQTGVGRFCGAALGALAGRRDVAVRAFAVSWRRRHHLRPVLPAGVEARQRAMPARPLLAAWRRGLDLPVEWWVGRCDVVHGTNFVVPPARRAARVVTVHDLTTVRYPELCDGPTRQFPDLVRRALAEGAWVHTPSVAVADEVVADLGADPARVRAVHHGLPPLAAPAPGSIAQHLPLPEGTHRYILSVGTVEPRKDHPLLVAAFDELAARFDDLALVLVGPDGWGASALDEALARCRARHRVVRTGYLPDPVLARAMAEATALAYPSRYEGFGFPPLEAMARGVPVVATAVGALPEVLADGAALVPPSDQSSLTAALAAVVEGRDPAGGPVSALVERGRRRAASFSWDACADGLVGLYRLAAADRRAGRTARRRR